jgi:hypothetical protein
VLLKGLFWGSLGGLAWTHAAYPAVAELAARMRTLRDALNDRYRKEGKLLFLAYLGGLLPDGKQ